MRSVGCFSAYTIYVRILRHTRSTSSLMTFSAVFKCECAMPVRNAHVNMHTIVCEHTICVPFRVQQSADQTAVKNSALKTNAANIGWLLRQRCEWVFFLFRLQTANGKRCAVHSSSLSGTQDVCCVVSVQGLCATLDALTNMAMCTGGFCAQHQHIGTREKKKTVCRATNSKVEQCSNFRPDVYSTA